MTKRKTKPAKHKPKTAKKSNSSKFLVITAWILAVIALILTSALIGYYLGLSDIKKVPTHVEEKKVTLPKVHTVVQVPQKEKSSVNERLKEVLKKEQSDDVIAKHEYEDIDNNPPKAIDRQVVNRVSKPKLAIIIDDVSTKTQIKSIKDVGITLSMSFLPPSSIRPNSAKLAAKEKFYMVHLPMEAMHFNKEEPYTLRVNDSQETIEQRIDEIKQLFPKVAYINNHTGSKFTADEIAVNKLINVLQKEKIHFIDSRTIGSTKVPKVMKNFGLPYMSRDVFLDNKQDESYIIGQIKQAIRVAKAHGTAIAIGHPHKDTLQALKDAKNLFKDVDLVQVDKLY